MQGDAQVRGHLRPQGQLELGVPVQGEVAGDPESGHLVLDQGLGAVGSGGGCQWDGICPTRKPVKYSKEVSKTIGRG